MATSKPVNKSPCAAGGKIQTTAADADDNGTAAARTMLDLFASVGATRFTASWLKGAHQPRRPRSLRESLGAVGGPLPKADNDDWLDAVHIDGIGYADLRRTIPALLETSAAEQLSLIIRPYGPDVMFIQLDDLTAGKLPQLAPAMFLIFETSPGNFRPGWRCPGSTTRNWRAAASPPHIRTSRRVAPRASPGV
jgi:hypothetical protein